MKTRQRIAIALGLAFAAITAAVAAAAAPAAPAAPANEPLTTLAGQVVSVDAKAGTLLVKIESGAGDSRNVSFSVTPDTKILLKGSESMPLASIKPGDKVTVSSKSANGKNVATSIGVEPKTT